jgi:hypothetical protein
MRGLCWLSLFFAEWGIRVGPAGKGNAWWTEKGVGFPNNRFHKGAQKPDGLGNNDFIIKRASNIVRVAFVPCEAER